jgi:hypothetical protein
MFKRSEEYRARPIRFLELFERDGWRLKLYSVTYGADRLAREIYDEGLRIASQQLPQPAESAHRPGIGFAIFHQGRGVHYLVLCWWDNENEFFNRVFVRSFDPGSSWRAATAGESACVWDLQVIWFEREAYVETILTPEPGPNVEAYLARIAKFEDA